MRRVLAALVALAALAGCGAERNTTAQGGRVIGPNLTIYSSLPRPGQGLGRDMVDAEKLAIAQAGGRAGDFGVNFVSIGEGSLGSDAPRRVAAKVAEQVIRDPQAIAVIGTLRSDTAFTTVPLLNAAGLLQVSLGAEYAGFDEALSPGEPDRWYPSGHRTFARMVGNDRDQAAALVAAVREAAGARVVDDPARATGVVYAGTDLRSAIGVAESLARENRRARIVFPDEVTRAGIADRLPPAVRRRSRFVTSAPPRDVDFEAAFKAQYGRTPGPYAVLAYQAMRRVLDAIDAAGKRARLRRVVIERYLALPAPAERFSVR